MNIETYLADLSSWSWGKCVPGDASSAIPEITGMAESAEWHAAWDRLAGAAARNPRREEADLAYARTLNWTVDRFGLVSGCLATPWDTAIELIAIAARETVLDDPEQIQFREWLQPFRKGHTHLDWNGGTLVCRYCEADSAIRS